jgi:ATP-dependent 26S proteasome regulatory subunit
MNNLKSTIVSSLKNRDLFLKNGLGPLKGVLVTGFTGTGKSTIVRGVVSSLNKEISNLHVKTISSINLLSRVVGGAEEFIRKTFT